RTTMRVAAIDLGTNTTRLLVADVADGSVEQVVRRTTITRLGEGVDERRRLLPLPIARVRNVLADYRRELERLGAERALAIATSAVRDAENGEAFLGEVEWSYGFTTRLLGGDEEAELTFRGVTAGRQLPGETVVIDIGGGSTELILPCAGDRSFHASLDIGSVRLTERFLRKDPPGESEISECAAAVRALLAERLPDEIRDGATNAVGVAGTVTTLAALELELFPYDPARTHGYRLSGEAVQRELTRLASVPLAERRLLPGIDPERAPVIVAGVVILREILGFLRVDEIEVSERDLLDGVALAAAELPEAVEGDAPPGAHTCC
ncbi:MAG: Ppx/GppA family phosphatase, partial [Actinomycetota bacterium]|nr:Ppx/GppA family phosphatase [Actinomycetota bacterium]